MKITQTPIPDLLLLEPSVHGDHRGFFLETFRLSIFEDYGKSFNFVQDNWSRSSKGVLRGLHFQNPNPQGKLIRVFHGSIFDVAVDIRSESPTLGKWYGTELNSENKNALFVPPGFAHGFVVMSEFADVFYKCTDYYHPKQESGIAYNDPEIGIQWPIDLNYVILSDRDRQYGGLLEYLKQQPKTPKI